MLADSVIGNSSAGFFCILLVCRGIREMPAAARLREGYSAEALRGLARRSKDFNQGRRLLSLAAVRDGRTRVRLRRPAASSDAARLGSSLQHLCTGKAPRQLDRTPRPWLSEEQMAEFAQIVDAGRDREKNGVVHWRRVDLQRLIGERFGRLPR